MFSVLFPDSGIASKFRCKRTKTSEVINHVLAKKAKLDVIGDMIKYKSTLLLDSYKDISNYHLTAIIARYVIFQ